jgi:hypothetical protein
MEVAGSTGVSVLFSSFFCVWRRTYYKVPIRRQVTPRQRGVAAYTAAAGQARAPVPTGVWLFYCDRLGQVSGLIYVAPSADGDVVGQQLQGDDLEDGC